MSNEKRKEIVDEREVKMNETSQTNPRKLDLVNIKPRGTIPKRRQDVLKWDGWGYRDTGFGVNPIPNSNDGGSVYFSGDRYSLGTMPLPNFKLWIKNTLKINLVDKLLDLVKDEHPADSLPQPILHEAFMSDLKLTDISHTTDAHDRLFRAHGQTLNDMVRVQKRLIKRIPDVVIWPECHNHVVKIIDLAVKHNTVVIPIGGGTCVSGALECPENETRMIISLDMTQMNKILWINDENWTVRAEAGIVGQDLERELNERGFCTGHEPDSIEFSSLGGWVATRASGMKRNIYGNIEDLLVSVKIVTPSGILERNSEVPRLSSGPDVYQFILGSEGTMGVVTEVTLKIRPLPQVQKYGSILFPSFKPGVLCLREIAKQRCAPASIRLMDNEQFKFGHSLKPSSTSVFAAFADSLKKMYVTKIKGFDTDQMCVTTLLFEGTKEDVENQEKKIFNIASKFGGFSAGEENGRRGYRLTYVIAYMRDIGLHHNVLGESFETSVPWDRVIELCSNVKRRIAAESKKHELKHCLLTHRVTQIYDAGACIYFYLAFPSSSLVDNLELYEHLETVAREEIFANGGSISHHHGVGKLRKKWLEHSISPVGIEMLRSVKLKLDPQNIFANGNLTG